MNFDGWWKGRPEEVFWLEVTDRKDVGADLNAPQLQDNGREYYGYSLIQAIQENDVVFHYHKEQKAIIAWSRATGSVWPDEVKWAAHGTTARTGGVRPYMRPGWRLGLAGTEPLVPIVTLAELRTKQDEIQSVRVALEQQYGRPIYFPFEPPETRGLRPTQAYLTKLPVSVVRIIPGLLRVANRADTLQEPGGLAEAESSYGLGAPYRPADEDAAISERDPFSIDPSLVERANRGHATTQNALANYLHQRRLEPRSPTPQEPNYDIAWTKDGVIYVAEVKSLSSANEEKQLRLGLGQVLRYRHLLSQDGRQVTAVLVSERKPTDTTWLRMCQDLGVRLVWPANFARL